MSNTVGVLQLWFLCAEMEKNEFQLAIFCLKDKSIFTVLKLLLFVVEEPLMMYFVIILSFAKVYMLNQKSNNESFIISGMFLFVLDRTKLSVS